MRQSPRALARMPPLTLASSNCYVASQEVSLLQVWLHTFCTKLQCETTYIINHQKAALSSRHLAGDVSQLQIHIVADGARFTTEIPAE